MGSGLVLDCTAGNRRMWNKGARGQGPSIIFTDREKTLTRSPDVFCDFRHLPFRDVFSLTILDPPYHVGNESYRFHNPDGAKKYVQTPRNIKTWGHYGFYRSKRELVLNLIHGAREISRVSKRIAFKWGSGTLSLWRALSCFTSHWLTVYTYDRIGHGYHHGKNRTYWVTMIRRREQLPKS